MFSSFKLAQTSLNFTGSALSSLSTCFVIIYFLTSAVSRSHFRHKLILNLAIADFINSTNNAVSAAYVLSQQEDLTVGRACVANGFISQASVQATDCAILSIAVVTVYMIVNANRMPDGTSPTANRRIYAICGVTWLLPCVTAFFALGKGYYGPVSGSWCWLVAKPVYLRYVLTHGWRLLFMAIELCLYTHLYFFLKRKQYQTSDNIPMRSSNSVKMSSTKKHERPSIPRPVTVEADIRRVLLLRAYPMAYIILWIPGILNRFFELTGKSVPVLQLMQASTQFVGLANALTYGFQLRRSNRRR